MAEPEEPQSWTSTIGQLTPIDPSLLNGEESVEITTSTRADGGEGQPKKTYRATIYDILEVYAARRDNPNKVTAEQVGALGKDDAAVDALKLGGKPAEEYLLVADFQQTFQNVTSDINEIAEAVEQAQ